MTTNDPRRTLDWPSIAENTTFLLDDGLHADAIAHRLNTTTEALYRRLDRHGWRDLANRYGRARGWRGGEAA